MIDALYRCRPLGRLALVAGSGLLLALLGTPASASSDSEVERLRKAIEESRERVVGHERQERDLLELLEQVDRGLEDLRSEVARTQQRADDAEAALREIEPRLERVRRELAATRRAMARRAVALYKAGEAGPLRVLFSSASLPELLAKASVLERLLEHDAGLVARFSDDYERLRGIEREAAETARGRDEALELLERRSAALAAERDARQQMLVEVQADRGRERALLVELERAARALEETLAGLGASSREAVPSPDGAAFSSRRGSLAWPAAAAIRQPFGRVVDADYRTEIFRKGVEFAAGAGDSVHAVAHGQIRFAGWFRGYGKIVIVDHGDGYFSVSGHMAEIYVELGDSVEEGDTIGTVGDTGSLSGPGLYFELREGSTPLDPADWLGAG